MLGHDQFLHILSNLLITHHPIVSFYVIVAFQSIIKCIPKIEIMAEGYLESHCVECPWYCENINKWNYIADWLNFT
jgi:hypothetical protein